MPVTRTGSSSVGAVLTALGSTGLTLASGSPGRDLTLTRTVLHDPHAVLENCPGGILLAPGTTTAEPAAGTLLRAAAGHGFAAVVLKAYGADVAEPARVADEVGIALLVVHDDVEWLHLNSLLDNAMATATQVGRSLATVAVGDLFALAGAVADAVGGATAIEDFSQRILAYSTDPAHPTDPDRREGILGRQVPDTPVNDQQYRAVYRSRGVVRFPATPPALPRMAVAVRAGRELLGSIWVVDDPLTGLRAGGEQALLAAAPIAGLHLLRARSSEDLVRQQRGEMVRRLFDGEPGSFQAADVLGLDPRGPFAVLAFAPTGEHHQEEDPVVMRLLDLVTVHFEARVGHTGATWIDGVVYVLASGRRSASDQGLAELARVVVAGAASGLKLELLGAVSRVVDQAGRLSEAWSDTRDLVTLLRGRADLGPVGTVSALSDQLVLARLTGAVASDARLVSPTANAIVAHDRDHQTTYAVCVLAYLDSLRDVVRAASTLSVHPNTLRYRLRRASELFGLDLSSADQVLALWLALRALTGASRSVEWHQAR